MVSNLQSCHDLNLQIEILMAVHLFTVVFFLSLSLVFIIIVSFLPSPFRPHTYYCHLLSFYSIYSRFLLIVVFNFYVLLYMAAVCFSQSGLVFIVLFLRSLLYAHFRQFYIILVSKQYFHYISVYVLLMYIFHYFCEAVFSRLDNLRYKY